MRLIFSFSALKPIDHDDILITRLSGFVKPDGAQVHIVPAAAVSSSISGTATANTRWRTLRSASAAISRFSARRRGKPADSLHRDYGAGNPATVAAAEYLPLAYARLVLAGFAIDRVLPIFPSALVVFKQP